MRAVCAPTLILISVTICCSLTEKQTNGSSPNIIILLMDDVSYLSVTDYTKPAMNASFGLSVWTLCWLLVFLRIFFCKHLADFLCSFFLYIDGLGGFRGAWSALQRDPQSWCHGSSGDTFNKLLHCKPTLFPMWVSRNNGDTVSESFVLVFQINRIDISVYEYNFVCLSG